MEVSPDVAARILVIARPALGRKIELALRLAGHEVYRTPDPSAAERLVARLRPHLAVVALDLPWGDAEDAIAQLSTARRAIPVLILGDGFRDDLAFGQSHLPLQTDAVDIQDAVTDLLTSPSATAS